MSIDRILFRLCLVGTLVAVVEAKTIMNPLLNFNADTGTDEPIWRSVNDDVMGGSSSSRAVLVDELLRFEGALSLENNGGFASIRTIGRSFDFSQVEALRLRVRGDGRSYQLRLATDARFRGIAISYGKGFATVPDQWTEVRIPLAELTPTVRGWVLDGPPLDPSTVRQIGLLIADKREGAFKLDVDWIGLEMADAAK